ncbi:hypothetical protein [Dokdonia sp.]|uniref:hypothetical protein n=1 Tax=Dokdonia sp. TaxID=2024995 RepID=UPI003266C2B8
MNYKSAFDAITCILKSCYPETQEKIVKEITKNQEWYQSEWDKANGIPSPRELRQRIMKDLKIKVIKAGSGIQREQENES